jgi:hypothetical protein
VSAGREIRVAWNAKQTKNGAGVFVIPSFVSRHFSSQPA